MPRSGCSALHEVIKKQTHQPDKQIKHDDDNLKRESFLGLDLIASEETGIF